jgi:hypothetical protein
MTPKQIASGRPVGPAAGFPQVPFFGRDTLPQDQRAQSICGLKTYRAAANRKSLRSLDPVARTERPTSM